MHHFFAHRSPCFPGVEKSVLIKNQNNKKHYPSVEIVFGNTCKEISKPTVNRNKTVQCMPTAQASELKQNISIHLILRVNTKTNGMITERGRVLLLGLGEQGGLCIQL